MKEMDDVYILAIESSCDETAAAVVKNGREVLSNVISSRNCAAYFVWRSRAGNCITETY